MLMYRSVMYTTLKHQVIGRDTPRKRISLFNLGLSGKELEVFILGSLREGAVTVGD